tara:strand:+ start:1512 stop:4277 length:2766 start_codon:yes stop_codon:yes gene_type:complete
MADQRLPQKDELVTPNDDLLIHVVDPNDISHYPTGTSKKMSRADFLGTQFDSLFTSLLDAPNTYTGNGLKTVQVNAAENALVFEFAEFLQLNDVTETTFTTKQGQIVKVNATENGLEFGINSFINLADVSETTLEYQQGKAVIVDVDLGTEPATYSLRFQNFPTFEDIYGGNAIISGGITYLGTGLNYNIWANRYIINGRYFDTSVRGDVTNNSGDATYDRFDVYFIEIDNNEPPIISVGILEGTPALNPIIPTLDLLTQVQVSVALIKANATIDPNAITEEIFNDNTGEPTEWTNITLPTGADLASLVDPKVGASSALFPAYAIPSTVSWQNDIQWTYVPDEELLFYIKPATAFVAQASLEFQLINSVSLDYWNLTLTPSNLTNYGYDPTLTGWQLIQIKLTNFVSSSRSETQFDTLKLTLNRTPELGIDWLVLQGGVPNPSVPTLKLTELDDVSIPTPTNRYQVQYDGIANKFIERVDLSVLGIAELDYGYIENVSPTSGKVTFTGSGVAGDPVTATSIVFNKINLAGQNLTEFLQDIEIGDFINLRSWTNYANAYNFDVVGLIVDNGTQYEIPVVYRSSTGSALINGERLGVAWRNLRQQSKQYSTIAPNPTHNEGLVFYDQNKKAISYYNEEADVTVNLGQELLLRVFNDALVTIPNGDALRLDGNVTGNTPNAILSLADTELNSAVTGVATQDILSKSTGYITVYGQISDVDTSAWSGGDSLYLSATLPGKLTNVPQPILRPIGTVLISDAVIGSIIVSKSPLVSLTAVGQVSALVTTTQTLSTTPVQLQIYKNTSLLQSNVTITQIGTTRYTALMTPTTVGASGFYRISLSISISSSDHNAFVFEVYINTVATGILGIIDLTNNNTTAGTTTFTAITPNPIINGDDVEIYVYSQSGTPTFSCESAVFNIERIGVL